MKPKAQQFTLNSICGCERERVDERPLSHARATRTQVKPMKLIAFPGLIFSAFFEGSGDRPDHHPTRVSAATTAATCLEKISSIALALAVPVLAHAAEPAFHSWAQTPPMGWNSWDCFATTVTEAQTKAQADYMAQHL